VRFAIPAQQHWPERRTEHDEPAAADAARQAHTDAADFRDGIPSCPADGHDAAEIAHHHRNGPGVADVRDCRASEVPPPQVAGVLGVHSKRRQGVTRRGGCLDDHGRATSCGHHNRRVSYRDRLASERLERALVAPHRFEHLAFASEVQHRDGTNQLR